MNQPNGSLVTAYNLPAVTERVNDYCSSRRLQNLPKCANEKG